MFPGPWRRLWDGASHHSGLGIPGRREARVCVGRDTRGQGSDKLG